MSEIKAAPKKGKKRPLGFKRNLLEMFGFMTRNSKDGFSETWFLSGNSVHFEIYDRVTSLDNPKTIINYKRHTEYIKNYGTWNKPEFYVCRERFSYKICVFL